MKRDLKGHWAPPPPFITTHEKLGLCGRVWTVSARREKEVSHRGHFCLGQ